MKRKIKKFTEKIFFEFGALRNINIKEKYKDKNFFILKQLQEIKILYKKEKLITVMKI